MSVILAESPLLRPDIIIATVLMVIVLLSGAIAIAVADRWKKKAIHDEEAKAADDLTSFRGMFEQGELTEEEYEKVRLRAAERMKKELGLAPPPAPNASSNGPALPPPAV